MNNKISPEWLYQSLIEDDLSFFTGVPDSLLKDFNTVILTNTNKNKHIITPNEGSAVALATGYHLATQKIPVVYMQNSGFGNAINPLLSLVDVHSIPMLIFIGWRGQPNIHDEPQHIKQGHCMTKLIEALGFDYSILPVVENEATKCINIAIKNMMEKSKPYIILVQKNTFIKSTCIYSTLNNYSLFRSDVIDIISDKFKDDVILSTTGKISRELMEHRYQNNLNLNNVFMNVGAMGHVSMIALGIAINCNKRVVCLDGDGSVLMHMGNLSTVGVSKTNNFIHFVINNGMHESVGCQPTVAFDIDLASIAYNSGYKNTICVTDHSQLIKSIDDIINDNITGSTLIELRVRSDTNYNKELSRPKNLPIERKTNFMNFINNK